MSYNAWHKVLIVFIKVRVMHILNIKIKNNYHFIELSLHRRDMQIISYLNNAMILIAN